MAGFGLPPLRRPGEEEDEDFPPEPSAEDTIAQLEALKPSRPSYSRAQSFDRARQSDNEAQIGSDLVGNIHAAFTGGKVQSRPLASSVGASEARAKAFDMDERKDPTSQRNVMARAMLQRAHPDIWDKLPPDRRERLTEDAIDGFAPWLKEARRQQEAKAAVAAAQAKETQRLRERGEDQKRADEKEERGYSHGLQRTRILAGDRNAQREQTRGERVAGQIDAEVQKLSKDLEGSEGEAADLATLKAAAGKKDVPTAGVIDANKPDMLDSADETKTRQAALRMIQVIGKKISGISIPESEAARIAKSRGIMGGTEQQFRLGVEGLERELEAANRAVKSRYKPEALDEYRRRGGYVPGDPPRRGGGFDVGGGRRVTMPDGTTWEELPDGSARQVR